MKCLCLGFLTRLYSNQSEQLQRLDGNFNAFINKRRQWITEDAKQCVLRLFCYFVVGM